MLRCLAPPCAPLQSPNFAVELARCVCAFLFTVLYAIFYKFTVFTIFYK